MEVGNFSYLTLPVNMEIKKYSLNIMNEDTQIVTSELKGQAGIICACLMARQRFLKKPLICSDHRNKSQVTYTYN